MKKLRTMGRWPTVGELFEYYSRDDICAVIYYQSKRWKILMNFGDDYLLEPANEMDTRQKILRKLRDFTEGVKETERLQKYPTMHILKDRGKSADVRYDFMTEDDPKSWSQAFQDMARALDVLDAHDVYYLIKFSGHRSLHLMIPAEAFPKTFRGRDINEQFDLIEKRIKSYLPETGHTTVGLRVVYSTHPVGALVSIPLRREELPNFQPSMSGLPVRCNQSSCRAANSSSNRQAAGFTPWMANIYTVAVDFDWFQVPEDAVERNEKFLHIVFDSQRTEPVNMSPQWNRDFDSAHSDKSESRFARPVLEPLPVKAYAGESPLTEAEVLQAIGSEHPQERVMAARAALVQNIQLPQEKLKGLLHDTEGDVLWFGMEIVLRDASKIEVEDVVHLLSQKDDYLIGLGHQLLTRSGLQVDALCDYLTCQQEINRNTVAAAKFIADMDWQTLVKLPRRIQATSLQEWFEKVWVVCGSALCLGWRLDPKPIFETAYLQAKTYEASEEECNDKIHQLELLLKLRNNQPRKKLQDEPLFKAADELIQYGHELREIVIAMLDSERPHTAHGAARFLTRLWWDDSIDLLIQRLDSSSSRRKSALKALVDIGEPAVEPLINAIQTSRNQRIIIMSIEALGQIGNTGAIPVIQERAIHPNERIRFNAKRVLQTYFGIKMQPDKIVASAPDASEVEEH